MQQNTILIFFLSATALIGGIFVQTVLHQENTQQSTAPALQINLPDISGQSRSIAEWAGKIQIINFWATWCPPCLKEIPEFIKLQSEYGQQNLQFIGIAIDDKEAVKSYLQTININYPMLIAGDAGITMSQQLGNLVSAVPFTLIVNQQGQVIHRHPGELSRQKILDLIEPLL